MGFIVMILSLAIVVQLILMLARMVSIVGRMVATLVALAGFQLKRGKQEFVARALLMTIPQVSLRLSLRMTALS